MNQIEQSHIHASQMAPIDKESTATMIGGLLVAIFVTYVLYGSTSSEILFTWLAIISFVYISRWLIFRYLYRLDFAVDGNSYSWEKKYLIGTSIAGLLWGGGSYLIFPVNNPLMDAVIVLTVGGLVAAASVTYAPSKFLGLSFSIPALLPLSYYFFEKGGDEFIYMGMLVLIFLMFTSASNRLMYQLNIKGITLGVKNDGLINDLKAKLLKIESMTGEMSYQASHDLLTGLINRPQFEAILDSAIISARHDKVSHALFYMDLDDFKVVNDTCGHVAGDALLQNLAKYLKNQIRDADSLSRFGGDEFGLLLPSCDIEKAVQFAEELRRKVHNYQFAWDEKSFDIKVSIGVVEIDKSFESMTEILQAAHSACYVSKESGKNRVHVFQEDDTQLNRRLGDMNSAQDVQKSLVENRFVLFAQEIRANREDSILWHGEILIRMLGDDDELIFPDSFIPAAERYNLMIDIDKWVVNNAFLAIQKLEAKFGTAVLCSINLSGQSICDEGFLDYVVSKLGEIEISPRSVCFEITETAAISNFFYAEKLLDTLKGMGCSFSLDDFGSGLSSFGYLRRLDVDYLKIDGSFVKSMLTDQKDYAMVKSIHQIGKEMGIKTIAEFVEDEALHKELAKLGVDYVQGYGIGKPAPLVSFL